MFNLHYGQERSVGLLGRLSPFDHPFGRLMPSEQVAKIDEWIVNGVDADIVLVEELPLIYLRYLIRKRALSPDDVHVFWHDDEGSREIRLGSQGELLDPWPTGFFDQSLEFILGGFEG